MKDPAKYLKEGEYYPFNVVRAMTLPDGSGAWILRDTKGQKILLECKYYEHYHFKAGETICCRVDKINCSGRIFLEPPHPLYTIENAYDFEIVRIIEQNKIPALAVVKDTFAHELNVKLSEKSLSAAKEGFVKLIVKSLSKGIPVLVDPFLESELTFEPGMEVFLQTEGLEKLSEGQEYIVLLDTAGNRHLLMANYYVHYNISPGTELLCEVVKLTITGSPVLEPVHPFYRKDKIYELKFIRFEEAVSSKGYFRDLVVVGNEEGEEFYILRKHFSNKEIPEKILCKVEKYRKGQVFFEPVGV
jgi:hypothetical protein